MRSRKPTLDSNAAPTESGAEPTITISSTKASAQASFIRRSRTKRNPAAANSAAGVQMKRPARLDREHVEVLAVKGIESLSEGALRQPGGELHLVDGKLGRESDEHARNQEEGRAT